MKAVDRITHRRWRDLEYRDPRTDLVNFGKLHSELLRQGLCATVDNLRSRTLKELKYLEQRQAALFAYFISYAILKKPIAYAMIEEEDYDCILWWKDKSKSRFARVQLKEIVPPRMNPEASVKKELDKLSKYGKTETIVAVHINQSGWIGSLAIRNSEVHVAEIWLYASLAADQSLWFLYGDLLHKPQGFEIPWPT
jgi:hypothetical protein